MTAGVAELSVVRPRSDDTQIVPTRGTDPVSPGQPLLIRRVVGAVLTAFGVLLLFLVLFLYVFTPVTAGRGQHRLLASLTGNPLSTFALTKGGLPREGDPVALLRIPSLGLTQAVVAGTSASDLESGPGLMPGTVLPGEQGNAVIAARRMTFGGPFRSIGLLRRGDEIMVTDGVGSFRYGVTSVRTVATGQRDVIGGSHGNQLTLVTSNSGFVPTGRQVVEATLIGRPVVAPVPITTYVPSDQRGLSGQPGAGWLILVWGALFLSSAAVTAWALARWRRPLPTYLLAAPILIACGLFAVQAVALALPATL